MTTPNTTAQTIVRAQNAIVISHIIKGPAATAVDLLLTKGTFVCNGATPVTVTDSAVTANSAIVITLKTVGGTVSPSAPYIATITAGTGFTVTGTATDTSTYNYCIIG
jgi:hypothetical protein